MVYSVVVLGTLFHLLLSVAILVKIPAVWCWTAWCSSNAWDFNIWEMPSLNVCWATSCYWRCFVYFAFMQMSDITLFSEFFFPNPFPVYLTPNLLSALYNWWHQSQQEGGGGCSRYKLLDPGRLPWVQLCCTYFCLSWLCCYLSVVWIIPFRPSPCHSAVEGWSLPI